MPLIHTIDGVRHVKPATPITEDHVPHQRHVELALAVLRARHGEESGEQLGIIERALSHRRMK